MKKVSAMLHRSNRFSKLALCVSCLWLASVCCCVGPPLAAAGDQKIDLMATGPEAGHYVEWNGVPILLIGDSVTQGWMECGVNFDHHAYVDALASRGMNLLMIWSYMATRASGQVADSRIGYDAPEIWPWVGSPDDASFDLTELNSAYFDRLRELVAYAESRGVVVLICVHDGWTKTRFDGHPFNGVLGNGPLTEEQQYVELFDYDHEMPELYNPSWGRQEKNQYFQERFCDRLITELNGYSNVIYEMMNEGDWYDDWYGRSLRNDYEQHFLRFFRSRCDNLLLTNTDHIPGDDPHHDTKVGVVTYHGDWTGRFGDFAAGYNTNPAKPYLLSEPVPGWDGSNVTLASIRRSMWEVALAGAGWVNQNDLSFGWDSNAAIASQSSLRDQAYDAAGHCARFFNGSGLDFSVMRPCGSLSSTGICMAQQGVAYVAYAPSGGEFTVDLTAVGSGSSCTVEWYDPRQGTFVLQESVQGGVVQNLGSPGDNDWVALITADAPDASAPNDDTTPVLSSLHLVDHNYAYPGEDWSNAIDGDTQGWDGTVTAKDSPPWAIFAFSDNATKTVSKVRLLTDTGVGYSDRWVKRFTVQVSTTDTAASSFVTVLDRVSKSGGAWQEYTIDPAQARYVKLILNEPASGWRQVGEFEVYVVE